MFLDEIRNGGFSIKRQALISAFGFIEADLRTAFCLPNLPSRPARRVGQRDEAHFHLCHPQRLPLTFNGYHLYMISAADSRHDLPL